MSFDFLTRKLSILAMIWKLYENDDDADKDIDGDNDVDNVDEKDDDDQRRSQRIWDWR